MSEEWMPGLKLRLTWDEFHQLPRNPAYKYEYLDGDAYLTPRPRHYHAVLDLAAARPVLEAETPVDDWIIRRVRAREVPRLVPLFCAAFDRTQPFGGLGETKRKAAAQKALERTRNGGDGPWVEEASFVAVARERKPRSYPYAGALFITLVPGGDPTEPDSYYWREPAPADLLERRQGWPHLTWIFVGPLVAGHGIGTALLAAAVARLQDLGYTQLYSTFMAGNDSSMLWHWRSGFQLLPYALSYRVMHRRYNQRKK